MDNIDTTDKGDHRSAISLISNSSSHKRRAIIDLSSMDVFEYGDKSFDLANVSKAIVKEDVHVTDGSTNTSVSVILTHEIFNGAYTFKRDVLYSTAVYVSAYSPHTERDEKRLDCLPIAFVEMLKSYL